jgi:hypothetical protein
MEGLFTKYERILELGNWEIGKLGNWEIGKLGNWEEFAEGPQDLYF